MFIYQAIIAEYGATDDLGSACSQAAAMALSTVFPEGHLKCPDGAMESEKPKRQTKASKEVGIL